MVIDGHIFLDLVIFKQTYQGQGVVLTIDGFIFQGTVKLSEANWCWRTAEAGHQFLKDRAIIFSRLLACSNVKIYDPQSDPEIFCNLGYYSDFIHYSFQVNELILDGIASGKNRVTKTNINDLNERFKMSVLNFNPRPWVEGLDRANRGP